jgi:asparagine synthase (glutamine-hydrolysing)
MFRYLALMWNTDSRERSAVARELERRINAISSTWSMELQGEGIRIFAADKSASLGVHLLDNGAGLVLGEIFARQRNIRSDSMVRPAVFGARETKEVLWSQGRDLTSSYWGNYVAFLIDARARSRFVLKDPTGSLPCYFTEASGLRVLFSHLSDCRELRCLRFNVNWSFVRTRTVHGGFDVEGNPIAEVSAVNRGECIRFDYAGNCISRSFYWHPDSFAEAGNQIDDASWAAGALRATVRSCVHSLAARHSSVLQQTSGGLDSSIVLGCLADAPSKPRITCFTNYVPDAACDERRWARHATARGRYTHVEVCCEPSKLIFERLPTLAPSVEPPSCFAHWQKGPLERSLAAQHHATATFTGEGGDGALCATSYVYAVDHCMRRHGMGWRTFRTAASVATRRDRTLWNVLAKATRRRLFGTQMDECRGLLTMASVLVSVDVKRAAEGLDHFPNPWFSSSGRVPLETIWRLGSLAFPAFFYDLSTSQSEAAPHALSPLCAQPVVETALRIPADIHFEGGRIRGLARRAFAAEVPEPILRRQWKDRPLLPVSEAVHANLGFIRQALLDGALTRERILDRAAVELALRGGPTKSPAISAEILRHLDLELWIQGVG